MTQRKSSPAFIVDDRLPDIEYEPPFPMEGEPPYTLYWGDAGDWCKKCGGEFESRNLIILYEPGRPSVYTCNN